jgi:hypothetical protein
MMTDEQLLTILDAGDKLSIPYFGGQEITVASEDLPPAEALPALKNFLQLSNEQRLKDGRHLLAYCREMAEAIGDEVYEEMGGEEPSVDQIWDFVEICHIFFGKLEKGKYAERDTVFLQLEGNVEWEPEHGLQMSWADGCKLVKVGSFDGHPTNGHAYADPTRDQYIYSGIEFSTKP